MTSYKCEHCHKEYKRKACFNNHILQCRFYTMCKNDPKNINYDANLENVYKLLIDLHNKYDKLQTEYDAQDYARKRKLEYPNIGDQLDYIYHNGLTKWKADMITPVKEKYPK